MTKEQKNQFVDDLAVTLSSAAVIYLADTSELNSETTSNLRRMCHKQNVQMSVVKNTLLKKAFERIEGKDFTELYGVLAGPTSLMISDTGNVPAKLIKDFRKKNERPILKAAYVEDTCYVGDDKLQSLTEIKSREELIGDIIMLLQSPIKNVVGALQSSGHTIAGLVKTLSEREN